MRTKPRILFLCHSASRNGATILLLNLLRWLKNTVDWEISVLVNGTGPLLDEIRSVAETTVWRSPLFFLKAFPRRRTSDLQLRLENECLKAFLLGRRFDLIYANTIATWPLVRALVDRAPRLLWHIHELSYALRLLTNNHETGELFHATSRFVAVSNSVRETLSREFSVPGDSVDLVHAFVPVVDVGAEEQRARREHILLELGWPADAFVVGGCGSLGWRKGTDLFLQIAQAVTSQNGNEKFRFLWIGGGSEDRESMEFTYDLEALGLQGRCCRVPTTADVLRYYSAMDVFALTSREDPFPLVMLEAALHGIPVVCFANSGGGPEFVDEDAGLVAPYLDISAFAGHLMKLQEALGLRERLGSAASAKVRTHYSVDVQVPKILKVIEGCLLVPEARAVGEVRAQT